MEKCYKQNAQNVNLRTKNTQKDCDKNLEFNVAHIPKGQRFRQHLHWNRSVWNRYEIGMGKSCVHMGPILSGMDQICYLVPSGSTYEGHPIWNHTVPV